LAIVQISQITNRKGLQADLPQLAGAELGWSTDERRLFIGNGTLAEGAPVVGNTEILTEFSDILILPTAYTYKGQAAGYTVQTGPTPSTPISLSLQSWLDQFATVKDFGATGDGVTDDTDAINRALNQLYCIQVNPQVRRSLFFPAGVYRITGTILIPPYATLYGEGQFNSVISLDNNGDSTLVDYVARTTDSLQQTGASIGTNGAIVPQAVTISNLGFQTTDPTADVFLIQDAVNCRFQDVGFNGPLTQGDLTLLPDPLTAGVRFASTTSLVCSEIVFDQCTFDGIVYGVDTDQQIQGVTITNSKFNTLRKGVILGTGTVVNGGPTGVRITSNIFDNIYAEGIVFGDVSLNASGQNIFYNVGNHFQLSTLPETSIISILGNNNISISDMFERSDVSAETYSRINLNNTVSIATTNGSQLAVGTYVRDSGLSATVVDNTTDSTIISVNSNEIRAFSVNYTILRGVTYRTGVVMTASDAPDSTAPLSFVDDYVENAPTGVILNVVQSGNTVQVQYTSNFQFGLDGTITYSVTHLA
jgi:hypothetical protein